jgi:ketosteroid isomerase-like protein
MPTRLLLAAAMLAAAVTTFAAWQRRPVNPEARHPPVRRQENDEEALKQLVREWADAAVHRDVQTLDRIQADNFSGTIEGRNFGKRMLREALRSGVMKVAAWTIEDVKVTVKGNSAVVTGKSTLTNAVFMGDDYSGEYEWTDRFVKQPNGEWRAVTSHSKRVKK